MATVYLADDLKHERKVALKVLVNCPAWFLRYTRFRRELAFALSLSVLSACSGGDSTSPPIPTRYVVTVSASSVTAGGTVTIAALLIDASERPIRTAGTVVTWSSAVSGGSFSAQTSTTDASGSAKVVFTTSTTAGVEHSITAKDAEGLTGTSGKVTTVAGPAAKLGVTMNSAPDG